MPLLYTGTGDKFGLSIAILGDGVSRTITIDLSKSPFSISFGPVAERPSRAYIVNVMDNPDTAISISGTNLNIIFADPLPAAIFDGTDPGRPRRDLTVRLIYG